MFPRTGRSPARRRSQFFAPSAEPVGIQIGGLHDVLLALYEAPDHRLRMHELARAIVLSRSGLTRLVDRLEAEGLLFRERSGTDRRGAYAVLTDAGLAALRQTWPVYAHGIAEHFACYLSDEEVRTLIEVFQRVMAGAREKRRWKEA